MNMMKKTVLASAVSLAFAGAAQAGFVSFDWNGGTHTKVGAGQDTFDVKTFDWAPGNSLMLDVTPIVAGNTTPNAVTFVAQGTISAILTVANGAQSPPNTTVQLTYQMTTYVENDGTNLFTAAGSPGISFFDIFYSDPSTAGTAAKASDLTGCGFGTHQSTVGAGSCGSFTAAGGIMILHGTAIVNADSAAQLTQAASTKLVAIDGNGDGTDNSKGVTTRSISLGSLVVDIDVLSVNPAFFLSNITGISQDMTHTEAGGTAPFVTPNPSDEVVGTITKRTLTDAQKFFGDPAINNLGAGSCPLGGSGNGGGGDGKCGIQLQTDSNSVVNDNPLPAPGSLALLGLGLVAMGGFAKRRRLSA